MQGSSKKGGAGGAGAWGTYLDDVEDFEQHAADQTGYSPAQGSQAVPSSVDNACVFLPDGGFVFIPADIAESISLDELGALAGQVLPEQRVMEIVVDSFTAIAWGQWQSVAVSQRNGQSGCGQSVMLVVGCG